MTTMKQILRSRILQKFGPKFGQTFGNLPGKIIGICCLLGIVVGVATVVRHNVREQQNAVLIQAVREGSEPRIEASLQRGADANVYFNPRTWKPLPTPAFWSGFNFHWNSSNRKPSNRKPPSANSTLPSERAPVLSLAITMLNQEAVEKLLSLGANIDAPDSKGSTPLHYAAQHNASNILIDLLDHHADINRMNKAGNAPLHLAVYNRNLPDINVLLDKGADANIVNREGCTPMDILSFHCERLHTQWLVQSMTNRAEPKQDPQEKIDRHFQHQFDLLRPLIAVLEKNGAKLSEATQHRLIDSFQLDEHEIEKALE